VLTASLAGQLNKAADDGRLTKAQAVEFASNPNALIEPTAKASVPAETLAVLQSSLAKAIHPVFWAGAVMAGLGLLVVLFLPREKRRDEEPIDGERLIMAEQTTINARNQPDVHTTYS